MGPMAGGRHQQHRLAHVLLALSTPPDSTGVAAAAGAAAAHDADTRRRGSALSPPFLPSPDRFDWRVDPPADVVGHRTLTPEQKEAWQRDGYVRIPGFLTPAQLQHWRVAVDEAVAERRGSRFPGGPETSGDGFYSTVFLQILNLRQTNPSMRRVVFEAAKVVGRLACQLNDHPLGFRLYVDQVPDSVPHCRTACSLRSTALIAGRSPAEGSVCTTCRPSGADQRAVGLPDWLPPGQPALVV